MLTLKIEPKEFDEVVWQMKSGFTQANYQEWLNGACNTLKDIYESYEGAADVYVLGDIINLLQNTQIQIQTKDFSEWTDQEMFDACANKSVEEIKSMTHEDCQRQAIRYYLSKRLMDNTFDNPLEVQICLEDDGACGLSTLSMRWVEKLFQEEGDGSIFALIEGYENWVNIDELSNKELLLIIKGID